MPAVERFLLLILLPLLALTGCLQTPAKVEPPSYHESIDAAVAALAKSISAQLPSGMALGKDNRIVVVDAFFNEQSAEVTSSGVYIQKGLVEKLAADAQAYSFAPLTTKNLAKSGMAILGSVRLAGKSNAGEKSYARIEAIVREVESGKVIAQATAFLASAQFDATPTRLYMDMPMFLAGDDHKKRLQVVSGNAAPVREVLGSSARVAEATEQYNLGNFKESEALFREALQESGGRSLLALSGLYQSQFRLGNLAEAEKTFGQLVAAAVATGNVSIKFLFEVNGIAFVQTGDLAKQYPMWQRQLARTVGEQKACLEVIGHASRSGAEEYNTKLSARRATHVADSLRSLNPALAGRLKASGKGFSENIVGSGSDDAQDAIDRRVEFKVVPCAK